MVLLKELLENICFEKKLADDKNHEKLPTMQKTTCQAVSMVIDSASTSQADLRSLPIAITVTLNHKGR